jgi:hypothetical protein
MKRVKASFDGGRPEGASLCRSSAKDAGRDEERVGIRQRGSSLLSEHPDPFLGVRDEIVIPNDKFL